MVFLTPFFDCHSAGSADLYLLAPFRQFRRVLHCPYVHVHLRLSMRFSGILQDSPRLFEILRVSLRTIPIFSLRTLIAYTGCYWALTAYSLVETAKANGLDVLKYLNFVFRTIPVVEGNLTDDFIESLMPWNEALRAECQRSNI